MTIPDSLYTNGPFEVIKRTILFQYPQVKNLSIDNFNHSVEAIEYLNHRGRVAHEYPPRITWKVDGRRFAWSPRPTIKPSWADSAGPWPGSKVDYSSVEDDLLEIISISVKPEPERTALLDAYNRLQGKMMQC